jgi:hypothetical protein
MKIKVSLKENDNRLRSGMVFGKWTQFPTPEAYNALYDDDERGIYQIFLKFQSRVDGIEKNRENPGYVIKSILPSLINIFKILQETIKNKTGFGYEPTVEFKNMPNIIGKLSSMPFEGPSWQIKDSWDLYYKMEDIVKNELIQVQQFLKEDVIPMLLGESKKMKIKANLNEAQFEDKGPDIPRHSPLLDRLNTKPLKELFFTKELFQSIMNLYGAAGKNKDLSKFKADISRYAQRAFSSLLSSENEQPSEQVVKQMSQTFAKLFEKLYVDEHKNMLKQRELATKGLLTKLRPLQNFSEFKKKIYNDILQIAANVVVTYQKRGRGERNVPAVPAGSMDLNMESKTKNKVNLTESTQKKLLQLCNLSEYQDEVLRENALENDKDLEYAMNTAIDIYADPAERKEMYDRLSSYEETLIFNTEILTKIYNFINNEYFSQDEDEEVRHEKAHVLLSNFKAQLIKLIKQLKRQQREADFGMRQYNASSRMRADSLSREEEYEALNESVQRTSPEKMLSIIQKSIEQMIPIIIDWRTEQDIPQGLSFDRRFLSCENVFPQSLEENDKGYILHVYDGKTKQEVSFQIDWDAITYMAINWEYGER